MPVLFNLLIEYLNKPLGELDHLGADIRISFLFNNTNNKSSGFI